MNIKSIILNFRDFICVITEKINLFNYNISMSENFDLDNVPRDDSEVYLEDGFAISPSDALIPRFEQVK